MPVKKLLLPFSLLSLLAVSVSVSAAIITIEPDDYVVGTDLSSISPYVTLESRTWNPFDGTQIGSRYASQVGGSGDYSAPTGKLTFGRGSWEAGGASGFGMVFNQEVNRVSLLAVSEYDGLAAQWGAFDADGNVLAYGMSESGAYGEVFSIDIELEGIWTLVIGGAVGKSAIDFDHLVFEFDDAVGISTLPAGPEPVVVPLLAVAAGMLMVAGASRRRQRQARAMLA